MAERDSATAEAGGEAGRSGESGEGGSFHAGPSDLIVQPKLRPPARRSETWIRRDRLLAQLTDSRDRELVLVDAPVGYGKTGLLADWAASEGDEGLVAWLSLDPLDSDINRFLAHLVGSVRRVVPGFGESVVAALRLATAPRALVLSRIINELSDLEVPLLLIMDDYHAVRGEAFHESTAFLLQGLPPNVRLAIATRSDPPLPLGRFRASGQMVELRASELAFDGHEMKALLAALDVELPPTLLGELVDRVEGWPAGAYLAALSLRGQEDPRGFVHRFTGSHRHIADYLTQEVLRRQPEDLRTFLARTSIFDRFCADLCDAVLGRADSRDVLDLLEESNLFLVGLDDHREWYRYHHLFRELLAADLARRAPGTGVALHRLAGEWFASRRFIEEGIGHMLQANDPAVTGRMVSQHWRAFVNAGRARTVEGWIAALGDSTIRSDPLLALTAAWMAALGGRPGRLPALLAVAERGSVDGPLPDGTASLESGVALIRGIFGFDGFRPMVAALERAAELESRAGSPWNGYILAGLGLADLLMGKTEEAREKLRAGLSLTPPEEPMARLLVLSELSLTEGELGNRDEALQLADEARRIGEEAGLADDPRISFSLLAMGLAHRDRGELAAAKAELERALAMRMAAGNMSPWILLLILLALAPVTFALGDRGAARSLLAQARQLISDNRDGDELIERVERVERAIRVSAHQLGFGQTLTERELAVLSLLATELSQREIGRQLFLSLNTVKSHTRAIYRKLGVGSRSDAVERAQDLGLL